MVQITNFVIMLVNALHNNGVQTGTCSGDSGGPLVFKDKLFGVTSYGYSSLENAGCGGGFPDVFSSTAHYLDNGWIANNTDYDPDANFWCYEHCDLKCQTTTVQDTTTSQSTTTTEATTTVRSIVVIDTF